MLRDRNSIFFTGFILGAIFSYSGMMGFLGGCVTGAIVMKNFGKHIKQETRVDSQSETQADSQADSDWIDYEANTNKTSSDQSKDKDVKNYLWNFVKPWQQVFR